MKTLFTLFTDFIDSLRNNSKGFSQRKLAVASVMTSVFIANIVYILNCYERNLFDSTFILWLSTMIGFVSATFVALYSKKSTNPTNTDTTNL